MAAALLRATARPLTEASAEVRARHRGRYASQDLRRPCGVVRDRVAGPASSEGCPLARQRGRGWEATTIFQRFSSVDDTGLAEASLCQTRILHVPGSSASVE